MLIPRRGGPRSLPYPYDLWLSSKGYMLGYGQGDNGKPQKDLVSTRPADLTTTVAPTAWDLDAQNPLYERTQNYGPLIFGMGLKLQASNSDPRYYYTLNADLSAGPWLKGPNVTSITPPTLDSTVGVTRMFEIGGAQYFLNGRYCLKRTNDTTVDVSKDFGAGKSATDVIVLQDNSAGSTKYAYVTMGAAEPIWRFDGTTWTQHAEATKLYALAFARVGRYLYRASTANTVTKCDIDSDPFVQANWDGTYAYTVGEKSSPIQRMASTAVPGNAGVLVILKQDGIYSLDEVGDQIQYHEGLQFAPASTNGEALGSWGNDLYVTYNDSTFRLKPDFSLEEIGPERLMQNESVVRGTPTAFQGHGTLNLYAGWYNADTGNSYLCKLGGWVETKDAPAVRVDAWHGSITAAFSGKRITCLHKSTVGAPSNHSRLYLGFSDGTLAWFTLPCTPNPAACSSYTFSTADGSVYLPVWTSPFSGEQKALRSFTVRCPNASSTNYAQLQYRSDPSAAWTAFGTDFDTAIREKATFPDGTTVVQLEQQVVLKSTTTSSCPQVAGVSLSWRLSLDLTQLYTVNVLAADGLFRRDGAVLRGRGAKDIRTDLETLAATAGGVACIFPDESNKQVGVVGFRKSQAWDERLHGFRASIQLELVELHSNTVYGTYGRLRPMTYGNLRALTYGQLRSI